MKKKFKVSGQKRRNSRLATKDKSNAQMYENSAATRISGLLGLGIGIGISVGFYLLVLPFRHVYFGELFYNRGWIPYVLILLSGWAIAILILKSIKIRTQKEVMQYDLLPEEISYEIDESNIQQFEDHIWSLKVKHNQNFLVTRILRGLSHFEIRRQHSDVVDMMNNQSELDAMTVESSYSIIKVFIWAIPIFGFVGTVIGISLAIGQFANALESVQDVALLKDSLGGVTSGLGVAFDTTLLALILSLILMFPTSMMQTSEEDFLTSVDEYCNEYFIKRLNAESTAYDQFTNEEVAEAVQLVLAGSQGVMVKKMASLQDQLIAIHNNQVDFVENVGDITQNQLDAVKKIEDRAEENIRMMKYAFDDIITKMSELVDNINIDRSEPDGDSKSKKKGLLG